MKTALHAIENELNAIREAGTWREERIITTPQYSKIDTTTKKASSTCAPTTTLASAPTRS